MIKKKVGRRIKQLREKNNMTQEIFAEKCGLDRTYITSVERGERNISLVNLEKISEAFNMTLSDFFNFEEKEQNEGK